MGPRSHVAVICRDPRTGKLTVLVLQNVPEGEALALAEPTALDRGLDFLSAYRCSSAEVLEAQP